MALALIIIVITVSLLIIDMGGLYGILYGKNGELYWIKKEKEKQKEKQKLEETDKESEFNYRKEYQNEYRKNDYGGIGDEEGNSRKRKPRYFS